MLDTGTNYSAHEKNQGAMENGTLYKASGHKIPLAWGGRAMSSLLLTPCRMTRNVSNPSAALITSFSCAKQKAIKLSAALIKSFSGNTEKQPITATHWSQASQAPHRKQSIRVRLNYKLLLRQTESNQSEPGTDHTLLLCDKQKAANHSAWTTELGTEMKCTKGATRCWLEEIFAHIIQNGWKPKKISGQIFSTPIFQPSFSSSSLYCS